MEEENLRVLRLKPTPLTPQNFSAYGQVVCPSPDGAVFGPDDAQLHLTAGVPRFYIMRVQDRPLHFETITHHASVTQCLGSALGLPWYIGVAKPSVVEDFNHRSADGLNHSADVSCEQCNDGARNPVRSKAGHFYIPPSAEEVQVFRVEGPQFLKFHAGTWHAGPFFKEQMMDFYNLELADTNIVDHTTHLFKQDDHVLFVIDD